MTRRATNLPLLDNAAAPPEDSSETATLGKRVRTGSLWNVASNVLFRVSNILILAVVARIVAPDELGVFALAAALQVLLTDLAVLGVVSAVARADVDADEIAPTIVTLSVGSSLVLASLMAIFADPLASLLGAPQAADAIRILSICLFLLGAFAVPQAQLQRDFRQDALFRANLVSVVPSSIVLVVLASVGDGAIAFAWSRVAAQLVVGYVTVRSLERTYRPGLNPAYVRPLLKFGLPLAMANVLSQVLLNVDYVFVGRLMSTADVGLYMLAFTICTWPTALLGPLLNNMILPTFSRLKRDGADVSGALSYAISTVALFACPIAAFTCAFATPLITSVYGDKWSAAGRVLSVLALYGVIFVVGLLFANIIISMGRTVVLFAVQVAALLCLLPALAVGVNAGGLVGIGIAHILVITLITLPAYLVAIRRSTGVRPATTLCALWRPVGAAVAAATVAWLATARIELDLLKVVTGGLILSAVYFLLTASLLFRIFPVRLPRRWQESGTVRRLVEPRHHGETSNGRE